MDPFTLLGTFADSQFATTTGIAMQQITSFATSSVLAVFGYSPFVFIFHNILGIVAYGMIAGVIVIPIGAFVLYKLN